jgi:hypothetical protein
MSAEGTCEGCTVQGREREICKVRNTRREAGVIMTIAATMRDII